MALPLRAEGTAPESHSFTPEASALFLLGCGFLAAAVLLRRRQMRVKLSAQRARR
jgi:hypothetical protein